MRLPLIALILVASFARASSSTCGSNLFQMSAIRWEQEVLSERVPLEERFQKPLFYDLGQHVNWTTLGDATFSNALPRRLVKELHHTKPFVPGEQKATFAELLQEIKDHPVRMENSVANGIRVGRNVLTIASMPLNLLIGIGPRSLKVADALFPRKLHLLRKHPRMSFYHHYFEDAEHLSELGHLFADHMPGKTFIDLASGDPRFSVSHRVVAQQFGAADYVGVELVNLPWRRTYRGQYPRVAGRSRFVARYIKDDALTFARRLNRPGPLFVRIQGLETDNSGEAGVEYLRLMVKNMGEKMDEGDVLSVGGTVSMINPRAAQRPDRSDDWFWKTYWNTIDPADYGFRLLHGTPHKTPHYLSSDEFFWIKE